ncbi:hypothetical protein TNCV_4163671, partial [Trichonephila clavipes]
PRSPMPEIRTHNLWICKHVTYHETKVTTPVRRLLLAYLDTATRRITSDTSSRCTPRVYIGDNFKGGRGHLNNSDFHSSKVGNFFVRRQVELFTRTFQETDLHYVSHLSCHRSYGTFYESRAGRYAPDLRIGRRKCTSSRKIVSRETPRTAECLLICLTICVNMDHYEVTGTVRVCHE